MNSSYCRCKRRVALPIAILVVPGLLLAASAVASPIHLTDRSAGATQQAAPPAKPWPAPVGHRQPSAANVPAQPEQTASDKWLQALNKRIDRKLQICRDC